MSEYESLVSYHEPTGESVRGSVGAEMRDGAYVRDPTAELFAVLAEVSHRHGALLIAEDLGTVPEGFSEDLQSRGLLSSRLLLFEHDDQGFRFAASYPRQCLATANTHDLAPLAALDTEKDLALRRRARRMLGSVPLERRVATRFGQAPPARGFT